MSAAKRWVCTINNPTAVDEQFQWLIMGDHDVEYAYFAPEVGESGTPHLQGFFILRKPVRLSALKKLHATAHFEKMRGTVEENYTYCSKDQDPLNPTCWEHGNLADHTSEKLGEKNGEREKKRWKRIHELAREGDIDAFAEEFPAESFLHLDKFATWHARRKARPAILPKGTEHRYYWGEPGTGKSWSAREQFPDAYIKDGTKWWQNYNGEKVVIIDDLDPHHLKAMSIVCLKTWFDIYPFPAEIKGGDLGLIRPELFVVTSNFPLEELCKGEPHLLEAMQRRFKTTEFRFKPDWATLQPGQTSQTTQIGSQTAVPQGEGESQI